MSTNCAVNEGISNFAGFVLIDIIALDVREVLIRLRRFLFALTSVWNVLSDLSPRKYCAVVPAVIGAS